MWQVKRVCSGEEAGLLKDGWEPFAVSPNNSSYQFYNTSLRKYDTQHQTTDFIYLRKEIKDA